MLKECIGQVLKQNDYKDIGPDSEPYLKPGRKGTVQSFKNTRRKPEEKNPDLFNKKSEVNQTMIDDTDPDAIAQASIQWLKMLITEQSDLDRMDRKIINQTVRILEDFTNNPT